MHRIKGALASYRSRQEYRYTALPNHRTHTRLFSFSQQNGPSSEIHGSVKVFSRSEMPPYTALSYMCGRDEPTHQIFVDDRRFLVRRNLYDFLSYQNSISANEWYWIDAISIRQDDLAEKGAQVRHMGSIYEMAGTVLVWLGMPRPDTEAALSFLNFAESNFGDSAVGDRLQHAFQGDITRVTTAIEELFARDYWWRLWPVQEIVLARQIVIQCGRESIKWDSLLFWSHNTNSIRAASGDDSGGNKYFPIQRYEVDHLVQERADRAKQSRKAGLLSMMYTHAHKKCEDPRDRVYAMLSMTGYTFVGLPEVEPIVPDYQKPAEDLIFHLLTHVNIPKSTSWIFLSTYIDLLQPRWVKEPSLGALESRWQDLLAVNQNFMVTASPLGRISTLWQPKYSTTLQGCYGFTISTPLRDVQGRVGPSNYSGLVRGTPQIGDMVYDLGYFGGAGFVVRDVQKYTMDAGFQRLTICDVFTVVGNTHLVERLTEWQKDRINDRTAITASFPEGCLEVIDYGHIEVIQTSDEDWPIVQFMAVRRDLARLIYMAVQVHNWWLKVNPGNDLRSWAGIRSTERGVNNQDNRDGIGLYDPDPNTSIWQERSDVTPPRHLDSNLALPSSVRISPNENNDDDDDEDMDDESENSSKRRRR